VSRDILVQIVTLPTAAAVWKHLETSFASHSHARVINTRMALATTQKGSSSVAEYVSKMKTLADEMTSVGKKT
jgi:glutathionylspermidine synthase